jgi:glycosyltransferase involved in cell wall biosynthesis
MHILFITGEYPPQPGGVGAYTAELGQALAAQGIQVSVLTSQKVDLPTIAPLNGVAVYPVIRRWDWRIWRAVPEWTAKLAVDWVHVQYQTAAFAMHPAINLAPGWWRKTNRAVARHVRKAKIAWTYHDLLVPYLFPKAGARLRRWITERPAFTSDQVIVTNEGDYQQLNNRVANLAKIPIGSNIEGRLLTAAERQQRRQQRGYSENDLVIGYFGFLNRSKGGHTLARTLHQLVQAGRNAHLLMIGERVGASDPTNHQYLQEIEGLTTDLALAERVQWTGHQVATEVSADLVACDLLLLPYVDGASLRRGTLMAGLAHGCAIVTTTPQAPLPELVDNRDLLFVPAEDASAAAQAVARIDDDPMLAASLRTMARERSQLFSWPSIAEQHLRLYTQSF